MNPLELQPKHFRASTAHGQPRVARNSGIYDSGLISDVSVITRGEALGHELWVDHQFLSDVAAEINRQSMESTAGGVKARFTHPGLSSDGVGQKLGRVRNAKVVGDQVIADLHFQSAATKTPDGDLADYVMTLAEETPGDFGVSIVFETDQAAEQEHVQQNTQGNRYVSPDESNKNNFVHTRLAALRSADVVDSPAANPDGLFQRGQESAQEGESILEYALGLSDAKPVVSRFSVDPDRLAIFVQRFLERHQLSLTKGGDTVTSVKQEDNAVDVPTREDFTADLDRFVNKFGAENGTKWFMSNITFESALELHLETLQSEITELEIKVTDLEDALQSVDRGEDSGAEFVEDDESPAPKAKSLNNRIRIVGKNYDN